MPQPRAAILLAHGSPEPQWAEPPRRVRAHLAERRPACVVELAFLPPAQPDLAAVVADLHARGHRQIDILPLLISGGGRHVRVDVPAALVELRRQYPGTILTLCETALGATDEAIAAMAAAADRLLG